MLLRRTGSALATVSVVALTACQKVEDLARAAVGTPAATVQAVPTLARADSDMDAVLLALQALGPKPFPTLTAQEARRQPTPADAVKKVLQDRGQDTSPTPKVARLRSADIPGPGGATIPARVYTPEGRGPFPVVVYYHGGGWVIADPHVYDSSARAVAGGAKAIVVSVDYRRGPEHKFPAAHDDAFAAYQWARRNARSFGGDPARVAVMGESAGGGLAVATALTARERGVTPPTHLVAVYPIAGTDMDTASYQRNENARPLDKASMAWFFDNYLRGPEDRRDPRIDLVNAPGLAGLPPTTIVTAEIDPLRSDGMLLADRLRAAGVPVEAMDYEGVTHEFFGMGAVVADAKAAQGFVTGRLRQAFAPGS